MTTQDTFLSGLCSLLQVGSSLLPLFYPQKYSPGGWKVRGDDVYIYKERTTLIPIAITTAMDWLL